MDFRGIYESFNLYDSSTFQFDFLKIISFHNYILSRLILVSFDYILGKIKLKDRYHGALREMIEQKIEGKEIIVYEEEEKPVVDIMMALKESINQAKEQKKPMKKATGKAKKEQKEKSVKKRKSA